MNREEYIVNYIRDLNLEENGTKIHLEFTEEMITILEELSEERNISVEEFINIALLEYLVNDFKNKEKTDMKKIDIFDFYDIENIIEKEKEPLFVISPTGKHLVFVPCNEDTKELCQLVSRIKEKENE